MVLKFKIRLKGLITQLAFPFLLGTQELDYLDKEMHNSSLIEEENYTLCFVKQFRYLYCTKVHSVQRVGVEFNPTRD